MGKIEEDIEILEDVLHDRDYLSERDFIAIENLLQAYRQDEKIIKEMAKSWKQDDIRSVEEIIDYFRKRCE